MPLSFLITWFIPLVSCAQKYNFDVHVQPQTYTGGTGYQQRPQVGWSGGGGGPQTHPGGPIPTLTLDYLTGVSLDESVPFLRRVLVGNCQALLGPLVAELNAYTDRVIQRGLPANSEKVMMVLGEMKVLTPNKVQYPCSPAQHLSLSKIESIVRDRSAHFPDPEPELRLGPLLALVRENKFKEAQGLASQLLAGNYKQVSYMLKPLLSDLGFYVSRQENSPNPDSDIAAVGTILYILRSLTSTRDFPGNPEQQQQLTGFYGKVKAMQQMMSISKQQATNSKRTRKQNKNKTKAMGKTGSGGWPQRTRVGGFERE